MAIRFLVNGVSQAVSEIDASTTVLDYLRELAGLTGTKEGCAEGDCGACTVLRVTGGNGAPRYEAVNGCLMQIGQADGAAILTVEGLEAANGGDLTPVQTALADGGGTQCGFCTPGFVCAMFALGQSEEKISDEILHDALAGNLCRCTGYRPILDAARIACSTPIELGTVEPPVRGRKHRNPGQSFIAPDSLERLLELRAEYPDAMLLAGGTDLGLHVSKARERPETILHTAHVTELLEIEETDSELKLGSAVTYTDALPYLERLYPSFARLVTRIGSRQIRNLGTLGGNIGNASPIGDTLPCLIALDAILVLASQEGEREMAIEDFFIDYRRTAIKPGEVIRSIRIPLVEGDEFFRTYKVSRRYDQDISAVIGAFRLTLREGRLTDTRIAYGGMAGTPLRARRVEAVLRGKPWSEESAARAGSEIARDYSPIDDHRASATYRNRVAANLLVRLWRDYQDAGEELEVVAL